MRLPVPSALRVRYPRLLPTTRAGVMRCLGYATASSALVAAFAIGACSNPDGQTPTCINNVDQGGEHPVDGGCVQFAPCDKGPPSACCTDDTGAPLTGNALSVCLYSYGGCASFTVIRDATGSQRYTCNTSDDAGGDSDGGQSSNDAGGDSGGGQSDGG